MTEAQKIHNHNHVLFFKKMKPTHLHTRVSSRECSSPMVEGSTEGLAGYFSVAALSKTRNCSAKLYNTKKHLPKK